MKEREFWQDRQSGRLYAVEFEDGIVVGSCGPLSASEIDQRFLSTFDYSASEAEWFEANRERFDLYSNGERTIWTRPVAGGRAAALETSPLSGVTVADAMHRGVITCSPLASLRDVATLMSSSRVHALVVWGDAEEDAEGIWGIVSDLDLVVAAAAGVKQARSAVGIARTPVVTARASDTLARAAEAMRDQGVTHLVVLGDVDGRPAGVLSALDVARVLAERG